MAKVTKRLPIRPIPKQIHVSFVGDNVIYALCSGYSAFFPALFTKGMLTQESLTRPAPSRGIASFLRAQAPGLYKLLVRFLTYGLMPGALGLRHFYYLSASGRRTFTKQGRQFHTSFFKKVLPHARARAHAHARPRSAYIFLLFLPKDKARQGLK